MKILRGKLEIIKLAILGNFEKKIDNFEKCYYHFCFTNQVTPYCFTSDCHGLGLFVCFFLSFFLLKRKEHKKNSVKSHIWTKTMTDTGQSVWSYQISKTEIITTLFKSKLQHISG